MKGKLFNPGVSMIQHHDVSIPLPCARKGMTRSSKTRGGHGERSMPFSSVLHNKRMQLTVWSVTALARSTIVALLLRDDPTPSLTAGQGRARPPRSLCTTLGVLEEGETLV